MADSTAAAVRFPRIVLGEVPVMAGPGDEMAAGAGGRGHLRASHADREQVIGILKAAFVRGMLAKDEFDLRVGQTLAARTYADLAALTADLPAGLAVTQPPQPARAPGGQPLLRPGQIITGATAVYAGIWAYVLLLSPDGGDNPSFPPLIFGGFIVYVTVVLLAVAIAAELGRDKRSGGQPPRRPAPGAGGQGSRRLPSADLGGQLPPADPGHQQTAQAAPIHGPRRPLLPGWRHRPPRDTSRIRHSAALHQPSPAANLSR
jgi:Domain of unknown function (DUF1707)